MAEADRPAESRLRAWLQRIVSVRDDEIRVMFAAFAFAFCVLASNYVIRPLRDTMGVKSRDSLPWLFQLTLLGTLAINAVFGALVARHSRRVFIPIVYRFIAATLVLAYVLLMTLPPTSQLVVARGLFIWASVYNLLLVSLFWGFMADIFGSEQGKRLFGFIAAGASVGALAGGGIAMCATWIGSLTLLPVAACALESALFFMRRVARSDSAVASPSPERASASLSTVILDGTRLLIRSPYLLGIAAFILLYALSSTLIYMEQAAIVDARLEGLDDEQTRFFARIDTATSALALVFQAFLTGRLLPLFGLTAGLIVVPILSVLGLLGLEAWPTLGLLFAVQVVRRSSEYGLTKPAREVLYTVVKREEKYTAKSLVDTFVYRAGDSIGAVWEKLMGLLGLGLRGMSITFLPVAGLWIALCFWLSRRQRALAAARESSRV